MTAAEFWTMIAVIAFAVIAWMWAMLESSKRQRAANEVIIDMLRQIISESAELDALRCVNPICKRRNTPDEILHNKLIDVGRESYIRDRQETICKTCQASDCNGPDITKGICIGHTPEPPVEEEIEQDDTEDAVYAKVPLCEGTLYVGALEDMGYTKEEAAEASMKAFNDHILIIHPNHKPIRLVDGKMEFVEMGGSAPESVKEAGPFCGDCVAVVTCGDVRFLKQPACDNFELDDNH